MWSIGTVASQVFLSDQLCPVALILIKIHEFIKTSTKNRKAERLEFAKKAQRWARRVLELCLWTDETTMNLYLSNGKAKIEKKGEL